MKISSGEIRKGSNSKYLVCIQGDVSPPRYLALNLRTGLTTPVNSKFEKSTKLEAVQVLAKSGLKLIHVTEPVFYAIVRKGFVERVNREKFNIRSFSELSSVEAKLCVLKASVKPGTYIGNRVLEVLDE